MRIFSSLKTIKRNIKSELRFRFFRKFIKEQDLCFDVGANVGERTDLFLKLGARVVSVEPQPGCVEILREKYLQNNHVYIVPKGLSSQPGEMELSVCSSHSEISTFSQDWKVGRFKDFEWDQKIIVEMTTLDTLITQYGMPKFCKIDVEGFEAEVLKGLSTPIPFISFEYANEFLNNSVDCLNILTKLGYKKFNLTYGEDVDFRFREWVAEDVITNEIKNSSRVLLWGDIYATCV